MTKPIKSGVANFLLEISCWMMLLGCVNKLRFITASSRHYMLYNLQDNYNETRHIICTSQVMLCNYMHGFHIYEKKDWTIFKYSIFETNCDLWPVTWDKKWILYNNTECNIANLARWKIIVKLAIFIIRALKTFNQLLELTASATEQNMGIICIQECRYYHSKLEQKYHDTSNGWTFVTESVWKNSVNAITKCVGKLLSTCALKSLNSREENPTGNYVCYI